MSTTVPFLDYWTDIKQSLFMPKIKEWVRRAAKKKICTGAACLLVCTIARAADSPSRIALKVQLASLTAKVNELKVQDPAAYANFKTLTASLNARLSATNETQAILLVAGVISGAAGSSVTLPVIVIPGQFAAASIQADFLLPQGVTFVSASDGSATTSGGKSISTNVITGGFRLIIFGLNQTLLTQGVVANVTLSLGPNKTIYPIPMTNPVASDATGHQQPMAVTSGLIGAL